MKKKVLRELFSWTAFEMELPNQTIIMYTKLFFNNYLVIIGLVFLFIISSSCSTHANDSLEQALIMATKNRKELEKVLLHYQDDLLKRRAACFLIENMCGKGTIRYVRQGKDSVFLQLEPEQDLTHITASFLIENIDIAFEVWRKYPWCKHLSFDEFCRSILPYRTRQEPLDSWRSFYYSRYKTIADSLAKSNASMKEVVFYFNSHFGKKYIHDANKIPGDLSIEQIERIGGGTCDHLALNAVQQMHAIGVPLNIDIIPYHGKVNGGHTYNSFIDENHQFAYFSPYEREPKRNKWVAPLVQRICYELQPKQNTKHTRWNGQLMDRTLINVTSEYYLTQSVQIPIQVTDSIVYLATYNRGRFEVVAQGIAKQKKVFYPQISCELLYFPMIGNSTSLSPAGNPFIVTKDSIRFIVPTYCSVLMNGLHLYDIKKVLKLDAKSYTLLYWENGWKPLKDINPTDLYTLNLGKVPIKSLFLLQCNSYMGRMQRPFLIDNGKPTYY